MLGLRSADVPFSRARRNTFAATAFSSYGAFWLSYGTWGLHPVCVLIGHRMLTGACMRTAAFIVSPWSDIASSYEVEGMFANGVAFFLFGWFSKLSALLARARVERIGTDAEISFFPRSLHLHHAPRLAPFLDRPLECLLLP